MSQDEHTPDPEGLAPGTHVAEKQQRTEPRGARVAGYSATAIFVVFLITLLGFGRRPVTRTPGDGAGSVQIDLISCLGVAVGAYAVIFLALNLRKIFGLPLWKKAIGLIGVAGLTVHVVLALLVPSLLSGEPLLVQAHRGRAMWRQGTQVWKTSVWSYKIRSTYHLIGDEGLRYAIEYAWPLDVPLSEASPEQLKAVTLPLMICAYGRSEWQARGVTVSGERRTTHFEVVLYEAQGGGFHCRNVSRGVEEIRRCGQAQAAAQSAAAAGPLPRPVGTGGNTPWAPKGPEQWRIDGKTCDIETTYYLGVPKGLQFTVQCSYEFGPHGPGKIDAPAKVELAFPLMKHAFENGLYDWAVITDRASGVAMIPQRIGVVLYERRDGKVTGVRVGLSLQEIRDRIEQQSSRPSP